MRVNWEEEAEEGVLKESKSKMSETVLKDTSATNQEGEEGESEYMIWNHWRGRLVTKGQ